MHPEDIVLQYKMKKRILLSWSSGKDSAWALQILRQLDMEVVGIFSTVNKKYGRVAMHAVRNELLYRQSESLGLPLQLIPIPHPCSDKEYKKIMGKFIVKAKSQKIDSFAFGDLFLEDIRSYREASLAGTGIKPIFPLWGKPTNVLSQKMIASGVRAKITCIDPKFLPADFAGREYDKAFLAQIPDPVDPCGEKGEFHSFVYDGPMFKNKINISVGETVRRDGFVYSDLLPV